MDRWEGKVAVVTGASSGIGLATAKTLLAKGMIVVGFARRKEKMEKEMESVAKSSNFYARQCDITDENSVSENFKWVGQTLGKLHVLINNAGVIKRAHIEDTSMDELNHIFKVNVLGLLHCTKEAIPLMKESSGEAHIINVNSILGHDIGLSKGAYNVYPATKFAVRALSETLTAELEKSSIRVSSVSPGAVKSEMSRKALEKNPNVPALEAEDLANVMMYILAAPPHVEIVDIIMRAKAAP